MDGSSCAASHVEDDADAIAIANGTGYGLAASLWTRDLDRAHRLGAALEFGIVWINCWLLRDLRTPDPDTSLLIERLSEEHGTVRVVRGTTPLKTGDLVRIVPNHSCVVSNLVDQVWLVDGEQVLEPLPVAARGRIT